MRPSRKSEHRQFKKEFLPPFLAHIDEWSHYSWEQDHFPDALWVLCCLEIYERKSAMRHIREVIDRVQHVIDLNHEISEGDCQNRLLIDGYLTTFIRIPEEHRSAIVEDLMSDGLYDIAFSREFSHVVGMYPELGVNWLIEPWKSDGVNTDWEVAEGLLARCAIDGLFGQSLLATDAKYMLMYALHKSEKVNYSEETAHIYCGMVGYPLETDPEQLAKTRATIRAMYGVLSQPRDSDLVELRQSWARTFWDKNLAIYPCHYGDEPLFVDQADVQLRVAGCSTQWQAHNETFKTWMTNAMPSLYDVSAWEVTSAIVARGLRIVKSILNSGLLLAPEFVALSTRMLAETLIVFTWLTKNDTVENFVKFRDYGRGQLKLQLLNLEEATETNVPVDRSLFPDLRARINRDTSEEFLGVNLSSTFNGLTVRQMAVQTGLLDVYNLVYSPTSGDVHGEWGSLEHRYLQLCLHPLHRGHKWPKPTDTMQYVDIREIERSIWLLSKILIRYGEYYQLAVPDYVQQEVDRKTE